MRELKISKDNAMLNKSKILDKYLSDIKLNTTNYKHINELELFEQIKKGDKKALHTIVEANLMFVVSVAKQYSKFGLPLEDLINEGNLGMLHAANKFDPSRGFKFISFAVWQIRANIIEYITCNATTVRIPRNLLYSIEKIKKQIHKLEQEHSCEITNSFAKENIIDDSNVLDLYFSKRNQKEISLDGSISNDNDLALINLISDNEYISDELIINNDNKDIIRFYLDQLPNKHKYIVENYFGFNDIQLPYSIAIIADHFEMSEQSTRDYLKRALKMLKIKMNAVSKEPIYTGAKIKVITTSNNPNEIKYEYNPMINEIEYKVCYLAFIKHLTPLRIANKLETDVRTIKYICKMNKKYFMNKYIIKSI